MSRIEILLPDNVQLPERTQDLKALKTEWDGPAFSNVTALLSFEFLRQKIAVLLTI